ncbi:MAG: hypothetical protein Q4D12_09270 [Bacteroidales bacterium]|nr:hypothetical protein [Bacteroidales bacterium]
MKKLYFLLGVLIMTLLSFTSCSKDETEEAFEYIFVLKSNVHASDPANEQFLQTKLANAYKNAGFGYELRLILSGQTEAEIQKQFIDIIKQMEDELGESEYPILGTIEIKGAEKHESVSTPDLWRLWYYKGIDGPNFKGGRIF